MWNGCNRVEFFEGCEQRRGKCPGTPDQPVSTGRNGRSEAGNAANLMTGSGMQQARDLRAEETIEVVQNHEDGTGLRSGMLRDRSMQQCMREWTPGRVGGEVGETNPKGGGRSNPTRTTGDKL